VLSFSHRRPTSPQVRSSSTFPDPERIDQVISWPPIWTQKDHEDHHRLPLVLGVTRAIAERIRAAAAATSSRSPASHLG
jgi:hypothetical protein